MTKEEIHQEALKRSEMGICNAFSFIMGASWASENQQKIDIEKALKELCRTCPYNLAESKICQKQPCKRYNNFKQAMEGIV